VITNPASSSIGLYRIAIYINSNKNLHMHSVSYSRYISFLASESTREFTSSIESIITVVETHVIFYHLIVKVVAKAQ